MANILEQLSNELISKANPFFVDKRIVLVGPSSHLQGLSLGEHIDSFDLVVRINWQWPVAEHLQVDYGKRTDVVFHSCVPDYDISLQLLNAMPPTMILYENNREASKLVSFCRRHNVTNHNITSFIHLLRNNIGAYPFTGNVAAGLLMATALKELFIVGFSMYDCPTYDGYCSNGNKERTAFFKINKKIPTTIWKHDIELNSLHLHDLRKDPRLSVDDTLNNILVKNIKRHSQIKRKTQCLYQMFRTEYLRAFCELDEACLANRNAL